jgi:glyoxylase-like metal-dependent hydrolase (beta-lactamase superfamily II)
VLWTPGHTTGHVCLVIESDAVVLTGDHVLPDLYPGIGIGGPSAGNALADYLTSLDRLEPFADYTGLPGHGAPFPLVERSRRTAQHHRRRTAEVGAALDHLVRPTVWQVAAALRWRTGWDALRQHALDSALAQTEWHVGVLSREAELDRPD